MANPSHPRFMTKIRQIGRVEDSVEHVEVFRLEGVRTSIVEDLDPYPGRDALPRPTLSIAKSP